MDQAHEIELSCAPFWAHPDYKKLTKLSPHCQPQQNVIPWRDHWMQAVYYLPGNFHVQQDRIVYLNFSHDEYSLWFDVTPTKVTVPEIRQPLCECGFHNAYSRTRIGQLNDTKRHKKYMQALEPNITADSVVLSMSDGSLLGLSLAAMGCKEVICLEPHRYSHQVRYTLSNKKKIRFFNLLGIMFAYKSK